MPQKQARELRPGMTLLLDGEKWVVKHLQFGDGMVGGEGQKSARILEIHFVDGRMIETHPNALAEVVATADH